MDDPRKSGEKGLCYTLGGAGAVASHRRRALASHHFTSCCKGQPLAVHPVYPLDRDAGRPRPGLDEVLVLKPGEDGTTAIPATEIPDIEPLLDAGLNLAEILNPETAPVGIDRLPAF